MPTSRGMEAIASLNLATASSDSKTSTTQKPFLPCPAAWTIAALPVRQSADDLLVALSGQTRRLMHGHDEHRILLGAIAGRRSGAAARLRGRAGGGIRGGVLADLRAPPSYSSRRSTNGARDSAGGNGLAQ